MSDLVYSTVITLTQLVQRVNLVERDVEAVSRRELYTLAVEHGLALELERARLLVDEFRESVHGRLLLLRFCGGVAVGIFVHRGQGHLGFLSPACRGPS